MSDLRVLHVINKVSPSGGAEVSLTHLIPRLSAQGITQGLTTLLPNTAPDIVSRLQREGVQVFSTGGAGVARGARGVAASARSFRPDVISSSLYEANRAARFAGAITGTPVLCALVNTPYSAQARTMALSPWKLRTVAALEGVMARHFTSAFHALTRAAADESIRHLRIDPELVTVVPRGRSRADLGEMSPARRIAVRRSLGLALDDFVVLNVARQETQKGHPLLIEAFELLASKDPGAVLFIAGRPGAGSAALNDRLRRSPVADRVRVLGLRDDVGDLLCAADVFAFSSLWEGLGGAVLEAMALGLPIVSFDVPAVAEVLGDAGRTVPVGAADELGAALLELRGDAAAREQLSRAATLRFDEHFDLEAVVPAMEAMYLDAAQRSAPGRRR